MWQAEQGVAPASVSDVALNSLRLCLGLQLLRQGQKPGQWGVRVRPDLLAVALEPLGDGGTVGLVGGV